MRLFRSYFEDIISVNEGVYIKLTEFLSRSNINLLYVRDLSDIYLLLKYPYIGYFENGNAILYQNGLAVLRKCYLSISFIKFINERTHLFFNISDRVNSDIEQLAF